jgi:CRP-like cAMP-binding protein
MNHLECLKNFHDLSLADYNLLNEKLKPVAFKKGEHIVVPGQVQKNLYFVISGVQMSYFDDEHKTHVIAFTYTPGLCAIPGSFSFQTPSKYFLTCLTESEMDYISFEELQKLFDQSAQLERLFRKFTEAILAGIIDRHMELQSLTIADRFKTFCRRSPHLLHLVPHKYLASYLSIDPSNFSKLFNNVKF